MSKITKKPRVREADNVYFLKILLYFMLGLTWIKINGVPLIPLGLLAGVVFAQHDHFAIDRKIEYAILLVSAIIGLLGGGLLIGFWL